MTESFLVVLLLGVIGLLAGVGVAATGPGGVLVSVGLLIITDLPHSVVAGTTSVTNVATGVLGSSAYTASGQLRHLGTLRIAWVLALTALVGAPLGVAINFALSGETFKILIAALAFTMAIFLWIRNVRGSIPEPSDRRLPISLLISGGLAVAVVSAMFGVGGPLLTVPLLVLAGTEIRSALAASQLQSIAIAVISSVGYLSHGAVHWPTAIIIGIPQMIGVLLGWRIVHLVPAPTLRFAMIGALIVLSPLLLLHG